MVENALVQTSANANRDIPDSGVKFVSTNRLYTSGIIFLKSGVLYSPIHASKSVFVWTFFTQREAYCFNLHTIRAPFLNSFDLVIFYDGVILLRRP